MTAASPDRPAQVGIGVVSRGNRDLIEALLDGYGTATLDDTVPGDTDLCIVDEGGLDRWGQGLAAWKVAERPAYAPVLLLATDGSNPWRTYSGVLGEQVDTIQPVPAPRAALRERVEALLETREYSVVARERLETLELYERGLDGASIGITIADATDPELPLVYANDGFCELTGYDRSETLGRNCRFLQGAGTDEATVDEIRAGLAAAEPVDVEIRNYRPDGELFWNHLRIEPVRDDDGTVTHFLGFQQDVTERKTRELLLEQYERVLGSVDDPVVVLGDDERVLYANAAGERLFACDHGEQVTAALEDRQAATVQSALARLADGEPLTTELVVGRPDCPGAVFQLRLQRIRFEAAPAPERTLVVGRDITEIREHRNRLSVLDRVLRHNIRNRLTTVLGTVDRFDAAADELNAAEIRALAGRIEGAATDLLELSDAAREVNSTIDPGATETVETDLARVVATAVGSLSEVYPDAVFETALPDAAPAVCPPTVRSCVEQLVERAVEGSDDRPAVSLDLDADIERVTLRIASDTAPLSEVERRVLTRGSEQQLDHAPGIELWLVKWAVVGSGGTLSVVDDGHGIELSFPAA